MVEQVNTRAIELFNLHDKKPKIVIAPIFKGAFDISNANIFLKKYGEINAPKHVKKDTCKVTEKNPCNLIINWTLKNEREIVNTGSSLSPDLDVNTTVYINKTERSNEKSHLW